jgi:hypothetical protein
MKRQSFQVSRLAGPRLKMSGVTNGAGCGRMRFGMPRRRSLVSVQMYGASSSPIDGSDL